MHEVCEISPTLKSTSTGRDSRTKDFKGSIDVFSKILNHLSIITRQDIIHEHPTQKYLIDYVHKMWIKEFIEVG